MTKSLHKFNNNYFFISDKSFLQNIKIQKELRKYIILFLNDFLYCNNSSEINTFSNKLSTIVCIGGESYLFGLSSNFNRIFHYTNSDFIYNDVIFNNTIYKKNIKNYLIDYNTYKFIKNGNILILNLAKLNINILNQCNKKFYKFIIIINCHHYEFWKRIKYLNNYKLLSRKQFIVDNNYFVTVSVLKYKYNIPIYISLGNTCAIAYQLNKYGLRSLPFPFDWCKINIKQLNNVLSNNFNNYDNLNVIKFSNSHKLFDSDDNTTGSYLLKNSNNIIFAHELYSISDYNIELLKLNIKKRIKNFYNCKNKNLRFIINCSNIDIDKLHILISNLKLYFNNFIIICITNNSNLTTLDCNIIQNIKIYIITIDYNIIDWKNWKLSSINWFDIFFKNYE